MRLGVHVVRYAAPGGTAGIAAQLAEVARAAEDAGVDNLSLMDHYLQLEMLGPPDEPMLEGYTTLGYLAGLTSTVELQLLVTGVTYRHPGLLAKIVATLDVLSGGRAALGIGAAWYAREHAALGVPFPPLRDRFERLAETLQIVRQMWSDDDGPYEGRHYRLAETVCSPGPLHAVPVMVGGNGERRTLRLVAQHADACNLIVGPGTGPEVVAGRLAVLREHCAQVGRDPATVRRTMLYVGPVDPTSSSGAAAFRSAMAGYAQVGIEEVHLAATGVDAVSLLRGLGDHVVGRLPAP